MTIPPGSFSDDAAPREFVTVKQAREREGLGELELVPHFEPLIQRTHVLPAKLIADAFGIPMELIYGRTRKPSKLIRTPSAPDVIAYYRGLDYDIHVKHMRVVRDKLSLSTFITDAHQWREKYRPVIGNDGTMHSRGYALLGKGGATVVTIRLAGNPVHMGQALCHPNDNFCKSDGLILALERALQDAGLTWRS